ncbi:MAG TPA: hypothetical protein VNS19_19005 [Acidimicrobiales bacterium]|jgi:hypothetical protein|nr:hypothetical protein [Acidimicrobiales bacterium]
MRVRTKVAAIGLALGLVLVGSACGSSDAADKPAKGGTEAGGKGGDVDIDAKDGTVKYTDEDGNETEMNVDGEGASLPKGWPEDLTPPDSITLITSTTSTSGGKKTMTVLGEAEASIDELVPAIKAQITDAGYEIAQDTTSEMTGGDYAGLSATKGDQDLMVAVAADPTDDAKVTITMTVSAAS